MPKPEDPARLTATGEPADATPWFRPTLSTWIVGGVVALLLLVVAVSGGYGGALIAAGLVGFATAIYALVTGRRSWASIPTRRIAAVALVGSLAFTLSGAIALDPVTPDPASAEIALPSATPTPTPTPSPSPSPASLFTDEAPEDPSEAAPPASDASVVAPDTTTTDTTALALLATIPIKGRAPKTGYERTGKFGSAWLDVDRNGCDQRNDILARDLTAIAKSGSCKVMTGNLVSPFTAEAIAFVRGQDTSWLVQIDHVVALSNAWQTGAAQLTQAQRITFANDPMNLLAVDGRSNAQKGDGDTATWLPSNKAFRCSYVARQVSVKATYGLWVTQAERDAMARVLGSCTGEPAVTSAFTPVPVVVVAPPVVAPAPAPAPVPAPAPAPAPVPAPAPSGCDPNYGGGCVPIASDVDCAGGSGNGPEYVRGPVTVIGTDIYDLDRDGDGIAC